jgi:hypothetical protein
MSGRNMSLVTMHQNYSQETKIHSLVFLINVMHLINAQNMEHIKLSNIFARDCLSSI